MTKFSGNRERRLKLKPRQAVIYGGNGFVGSHVAKELVLNDFQVVCVSRTGDKPTHLSNVAWSEKVNWCQGDASKPDLDLLASTDVLVSAVGSAPLPTFSKRAYEKQFFSNGTCNALLMKAAADAGVTRVLLMGAKIPLPLRTNAFAYTKGKRVALEAAQHFSQLSEHHSSVIFQPGVIVGTRHTKNGCPIPLDQYLALALKLLPSQFLTVEMLAQCVANAAMESPSYAFQVLTHDDIRNA